MVQKSKNQNDKKSLKIQKTAEKEIDTKEGEDTRKKVELLITRTKKAQEIYATYTQEEVDKIFKEAAMAVNKERIRLAKMAVQETGMGVVEDKVIKNHFAAEYIFNKYKNTKTCGVIEDDPVQGIRKIAEPIGTIVGVIPTTNPTSTAIFKALLALKTRNAIIFSPHPRAKKCTIEAARVVYEAARKAGAPEDIIGRIEEPSIELTNYLMTHPAINLILATGGPQMVKAAYSSGKPALGVGPGNTPAIIDETADIKMAISSILLSKTFDNGMICASEQAIVVVKSIVDEVKKELLVRGAYILNPTEIKKVGAILLQDGKLNPAIVGQSAYTIATMAGIKVPQETKVLVGEVTKISPDEPFAYEKLSPVLAMYVEKDFESAVQTAIKLIMFGGQGHTAVLYTNPKNMDRITTFSNKVKTARVLVNTPSSHGAIGDIYNFRLEPSLTLGCGSWGGNATSENIGPKHLLNIKTVAERRENMLWFKVPPKIYFKYGCLEYAIQEAAENRKKAFIVTDKFLYEAGYVTKITKVLDKQGCMYQVFYDVNPDPTFDDVQKGLEIVKNFQPDLFIAIGGGSPMDATKIMRLMYEDPNADFGNMAMRFMDIRKRIYEFPPLGRKASLVCIPTTSGTGSEVTPFAVVTDKKAQIKYPIADYALTPHMAIIDPELVMNMPKKLIAYGGLDALTHAIESYVSIFANPFTNGLALQAIKTIFTNLAKSYNGDAKAREEMHYAATLAGMAFANSFLGITHSLAHTLGGAFHIPHGLANALLISHVIKYNATEKPQKQPAFAQYTHPMANQRYAEIADYIGLGGKTIEEKVQNLIKAIEKLKKDVEIPTSIKDCGVDEKEFMERLDELAERAFDDQCTGANPRYPLIQDLKDIYSCAFKGNL